MELHGKYADGVVLEHGPVVGEGCRGHEHSDCTGFVNEQDGHECECLCHVLAPYTLSKMARQAARARQAAADRARDTSILRRDNRPFNLMR